MRLASILLLAVLLAACGPTREQIAERTQKYTELYSLAERNARTCLDGVKTPETGYFDLKEQFILHTDNSNELYKKIYSNYISDQNVQDYRKYRKALQVCVDQMLKDYGTIDYRYANNLAEKRARSDKNLLQALNREITVGDRNSFLVHLYQLYDEDKTEIGHDILQEFGSLSDDELRRHREVAKQLFESTEEYQSANLVEKKLQEMEQAQQRAKKSPEVVQAN